VVGYRSRRYPADTVISAGSKSSFIAMKRGDETPSPEFQLQVGHTLERFPSRYHIVANSRYDIFTGGGGSHGNQTQRGWTSDHGAGPCADKMPSKTCTTLRCF